MGGVSITQLLIIAAIIILLFGTKKLSSLGSDLGSSIKGFKKAMEDDNEKSSFINEASALDSSVSQQDIKKIHDEERLK